MGSIPPDPPSFARSSDGVTWQIDECQFIEITCLEDSAPRYLRMPSGSIVDLPPIRVDDTAAILRQNMIGAGLLVAAVLAAIGCVIQLIVWAVS